jgi:hypothetical protein
MTSRQSNRPSQSQQIAAASARQNEYFVPRDGIDREVITSDICRYLGNDALVRPGTYEVNAPSQAGVPSWCPPCPGLVLACRDRRCIADMAFCPRPVVARRASDPGLLHHGLPQPYLGEYPSTPPSLGPARARSGEGDVLSSWCFPLAGNDSGSQGRLGAVGAGKACSVQEYWRRRWRYKTLEPLVWHVWCEKL